MPRRSRSRKRRSSTRSEVASPARRWARRRAAGAARWRARARRRPAGARRRRAPPGGARRGRRGRPRRAARAPGGAAPAAHAGADQRDFDVRARGERAEQQVALEDEADDLAARARRVGCSPERPAVDQHAPLVGLLEPADQRRAACSCPSPSARHRHSLAGGDVQGDVPQRADAPEDLAAPARRAPRRRPGALTCVPVPGSRG